MQNYLNLLFNKLIKIMVKTNYLNYGILKSLDNSLPRIIQDNMVSFKNTLKMIVKILNLFKVQK